VKQLPILYGTVKDTVTADNLIDHIYASVYTFGWTAGLAYDYFQMALHSNAENWIKLVCERLQDLTKAKNDNGCSSTHVIEQQRDESINQIKGNGTQNPYHGNYRGRVG
jgi:hypothetical protein